MLAELLLEAYSFSVVGLPHSLRVVLHPNFMSRLLLGFATACVTSSTQVHIQDLQTAACRNPQCKN